MEKTDIILRLLMAAGAGYFVTSLYGTAIVMLVGYGVAVMLLRYHLYEKGQGECSILLRITVPASVDLMEVMESLSRIHGVTSLGFED